MDSFTAGLIFWAVTLCAAYGVGVWATEPKVAEACNKDGEYTVRGVVFECKAVAGWVNGKRVELKE